MAEECLFCRIARGDIPAREVLRTEYVVAFHDINPGAPVHVLVVPVTHYETVGALDNESVAGRLLLAAAEVARIEGIGTSGYRVVLNTGADAGQSVNHVHAHVLGGRALSWPPG